MSGIAVEPGSLFPELQRNMKPFPNLRLVNEGVSPSTAATILQYTPSLDRHGVARSMDIFKLDIDGVCSPPRSPGDWRRRVVHKKCECCIGDSSAAPYLQA